MVGYEDYSYTYETMSGSTNDMSLSSFPYLDLANKNALAVAGNSYQNAYLSLIHISQADAGPNGQFHGEPGRRQKERLLPEYRLQRFQHR